MRKRNDKPKEFQEVVLEVKRVMRVVKGGKRLRFRALVVIGNGKGKVGIGLGKAGEVAEGIRKAAHQARKNLIVVPVNKAGTIPHEVALKVNASRLYLRPAVAGTGIIAGGVVRQILGLTGVRDILSKAHGSLNKTNLANVTIDALATLKGEYEFVAPEPVIKRADPKLAAEGRPDRKRRSFSAGGRSNRAAGSVAPSPASTPTPATTALPAAVSPATTVEPATPA